MNTPIRRLSRLAARGRRCGRRDDDGASARPTDSQHGQEGPPAGLTLGWEAGFNLSDGFDPTGEYLGDAFGIYSNLLIRTLVGYNHVAGAAGNKLVPDLATTVPKPTNGGKTYTFKLKQGIKFGPPRQPRRSRRRTSSTRCSGIANPKNGGQYALLLQRDPGLGRLRAARRRRSPASRRRTPRRS